MENDHAKNPGQHQERSINETVGLLFNGMADQASALERLNQMFMEMKKAFEAQQQIVLGLVARVKELEGSK